jgi:hypothetical protein
VLSLAVTAIVHNSLQQTLLCVFLPPKLMIENYSQEFGGRRWIDGISIHGKLALALFFALPGNVNKLGLFRSEAGPSAPGPGFDPGYVFGLDFGHRAMR